MPWNEVSVMDQRREFVRLALVEGANRRELCRRFGISAGTGYKWLQRSDAGEVGLADRSRRPLTSPKRSAANVEAAVLAIRDAHPAWGARKITACLVGEKIKVPASSTVHAILVRHGRIGPLPGGPRATLRFEKEAPNLLWQMDFKGWVAMGNGQRLHPLTVVDDHSRFALCLAAGVSQTNAAVQARLTPVFQRYGLPQAMFVDNGTPWGDSSGARWTRFGVWLLKLGIDVIHSRPYHPQSRGKIERFHRTLNAEVLALRLLRDLDDAQSAFDTWRGVYNFERPHEALAFATPARHYRMSQRPMPEHLPEPQYDHGEVVRKISRTDTRIAFKGRFWRVPQAFGGERLAIRPLNTDGLYGVYFASHHVATIDLTKPKTVNYVSEQVSTMSPG
jgi:transposase InsO family protein